MDSSAVTLQTGIPVDAVTVARLENAQLQVDVSPETGGRVTRLYHKTLDRDFLWRNPRLALAPAPYGAPYDPNFYGGLDDVIPGDLPERIGDLDCPDHGELWTLPLQPERDGPTLRLRGQLPRWGLRVSKHFSLRPGASWLDVDYQIENVSGERRVFLWKLHAAAAISPGDQLDCPAATGSVADPRWSRWGAAAPFAWPLVAGQRADVIPPADGTTDFLFLSDLRAGRVGLRRPDLGAEFSLAFDPQVFPYVCVFASYGGFDGHYTAVLEPSTAMPLSVNEAARLGQCSRLAAGARLTTRVSLYAGPLRSDTG